MLLVAMTFRIPLVFEGSIANTNISLRFPYLSENWYKHEAQAFESNLGSPGLDYQHFSPSLSVLCFVTKEDYNFNVSLIVREIAPDVEEFYVVSLPSDPDLHDIFEHLYSINIEKYDFILFPYELPFPGGAYDIRFRTNNFYDPEYWKNRHYFPIKQVYYVIEYYNKLFIKDVTNPVEYKDVFATKLWIRNTQILTTAFDQLDTLALNALYVCHVSPNFNQQSDSSLCQFAAPHGIGGYGIKGTGSIGDALLFATQLIGYASTIGLSLFDRISVVKYSIKYRKFLYYGGSREAMKYQPGLGFGVLSAKSLKYYIDDFKGKFRYNSDQELTVLSKNDLKQGDEFNIGNIEVYRIYVTMRGDKDEFPPFFEFEQKSHFNNKQMIRQYEGIYVYIYQYYGDHRNPYLMGFLAPYGDDYDESAIRFIMQQNNMWNMRICGQLGVFFTREKNQTKVVYELNSGNPPKLDVDLRIALTIVCKLNQVETMLLTSVKQVFAGSVIHFQSTAVFVYSYCYNGETLYYMHTFSSSSMDVIKSLKISSVGQCILYFCKYDMPMTEMLLLTDECISSQPFLVQKRLLTTLFISLLVVAAFCTLIYLMLPSIWYFSL